MKNLITALALAGSLVLGGCNEQIKENNKLEENQLGTYNQQNAKVYKDFVKFVKENGKKDKELYSLKFIKKNLFIYVFYGDISVYTEEKTFDDIHADGLDFVIEKNSVIYLTDLLPDKQLLLVKEYTEILKQTMHDIGVQGY